MAHGRYPYPRHVFLPTGSWWHDHPKNGIRNSLILFTFNLFAAVAVGVFLTRGSWVRPTRFAFDIEDWKAGTV